MITYYKERLFDKLVLELNSDDYNEIVRGFWSLYNHEATNSNEFHWLQEDYPPYSGYINTTDDDLLKAFTNASLSELLNQTNVNIDIDNLPAEILAKAAQLGKDKFDSVILRKFYGVKSG